MSSGLVQFVGRLEWSGGLQAESYFVDCLSVLAFNVVVHTQMNAPEIFQVLTVLFTMLLFTDKYTDFSGDYFFKGKKRLRVLSPMTEMDSRTMSDRWVSIGKIRTCIILHTFEPHGHLLECTEQVNQG